MCGNNNKGITFVADLFITQAYDYQLLLHSKLNVRVRSN
jgi:hypothetical protein